MFEAYKVAVRVTLINNVSGGLLAMSRHFQKVGQDAHALEGSLKRLKMLGMVGAGISGAGFMGLGMLSKIMKPAEEYAHQLNIMNMAGLTHKEIAEAVGDAWKNTGTIITSTATENLRALLDLRNVLGNMHEAHAALPIVTRIQAVLAASKEGRLSANSRDLAFGVAKAIDMIGKVQNKDQFESYAESLSKVIIGTQGRILPQDFMQAFKYARQAKYQMSQDFIQNYLPTLMLEMKGGGGGSSGGPGAMLAAMYRMTNQGYINKMAMPELARVGLINANSALRTTTSGTTVGPMKDAALAASNPYLWVQQVLLPAIRRTYGQHETRDQILAHINQLFRGNQLAASLIGELAVKPLNFARDANNIRRTMSTAQAYQAAISNDPATAREALHAQWENFKTALTMSVVPILIPALMKLTRLLQDFAQWARTNQGIVKGLVVGFGALSAAMAIGGTVLAATSAFRSLGTVLSVLGVGDGALGAVANGIRLVGLAAGRFMAVFAAFEAGHALGKWIDKKTGASSWIADQFAWHGTSNPGSQYVHGADGKLVQVRTVVHMDGRKVAEAVSTHQARALERPHAGTSAFDLNMAPIPVGAPILGR